MKNEKISDAIGEIDDELIEEAKKAREKKPFPILRYSAIAASAALVITSAIILHFALNSPSPSPDSADYLEMTPETDILLDDSALTPTLNPQISEDEASSPRPDENEGEDISGECVIPEIESITVALIPIRVTVVSIYEGGMVVIINDTGSNEDLARGDEVELIYAPDYTPNFQISVGDRLYITYGLSGKEGSLIAYEITTTPKADTPALF